VVSARARLPQRIVPATSRAGQSGSGKSAHILLVPAGLHAHAALFLAHGDVLFCRVSSATA
jgi:hypothetical protein